MTVRINPSKIALWRNPNDLQIGLENPVVLEGVTAAQEHLLALLERGVADEAVEVESRPLIERISPALLQSSHINKPSLSGEFIRGAFAELIRASYKTNIDGIAVLEARAKTSVHLDSLGAAGLLLTLGLAAAGIGRVLTEDSNVVGEHDIGPLAYPRKALGSPRIQALNELLSDRPGGTLVENFDLLSAAKRRNSIRILTGQNALAPAAYAALQTKRLPHIAVLFGSDWVSVSPRLTGSPCLGCLDLHKTDADPAWPALASQLIGRVDYLEDAASALFAASMVVGEILRAIDSPLHESEFIGHRLKVSTGRVGEWSWARHPSCECAQFAP